MKKSSSKSSVAKHKTWDRLWFLQRRIRELERVRMPKIKELKLLKRYRLEWVKLFMFLTP
jgi:hypothetical protein